MQEVNYVFQCAGLLKDLRDTCSRLTDHEEYPYGKIVGLLVSNLTNPQDLEYNRVKESIDAYLSVAHGIDEVNIRADIVVKSVSAFISMYEEIAVKQFTYAKIIYVKAVDPFLVVGVVLPE